MGLHMKCARCLGTRGRFRHRASTLKPRPAGPQKELCVIVDEQNNVLRGEPRRVTVQNRLLGRGSYVAVFNREGHLLVSKRTHTKDVYPGHLDTVISGVCWYGEEYEDTASRELSEELGLPSTETLPASLSNKKIFRWQDEFCDVWGCAYMFEHEGPFQLQEDEVQWAKFLPLQEVCQMAEEEQFTPVGLKVLQILEVQGFC